jgi:hypothetical protein
MRQQTNKFFGLSPSETFAASSIFAGIVSGGVGGA